MSKEKRTQSKSNNSQDSNTRKELQDKEARIQKLQGKNEQLEQERDRIKKDRKTERRSLQKDVEQLERKCDRIKKDWKTERRSLRKDVEQLERKCDRIKKDRKTERRSLQRDVRELEQKCDRLEKAFEPFADLAQQYARYVELPESRRKDLKDVLNSDCPTTFLVTGSSQDAVFNLWDYMREHLDDIERKEVDILSDTLRFMLHQYNLRWAHPVYEMMEDESGKPFDDEQHSRGPQCSVHQGTIEKTLLPGIRDLKMDRVERKSVVYYS